MYLYDIYALNSEVDFIKEPNKKVKEVTSGKGVKDSETPLECLFCVISDSKVRKCSRCTASFHNFCIEKCNWKCPVCSIHVVDTHKKHTKAYQKAYTQIRKSKLNSEQCIQ